MKISTETGSIGKIVGREKAVELVAKAGFDAWDFSMFDMAHVDWKNQTMTVTDSPLNSRKYEKYVRDLRRIGEDNGIVCNQSHAPFPTMLDGMEKLILRAIECTAIAGGEICIVHPDNFKTAGQNAEFYHRLLPFAKSCGVKIAAENMWNWNAEKDVACAAACSRHDDFLAHVVAADDEYLVACLDIGHAEMAGLDTDAVTMVETLGRHLQALHIHDNDKWHDSHRLPFTMNIDFPPIVAALKRNGYKGYFTLEADRHLEGFSAENVFEGVRQLAAAAKKLADMFDRA